MYQISTDILGHADLAARVQRDLEIALLDRFYAHFPSGENLVFSGGVALNSVVNHRLRQELKPANLFLLPAQHDAGVAIGAVAAAIWQQFGHVPNDLFCHDFLGIRYTEEDVLLAINRYADRLQVSRISQMELAKRIEQGGVFGFFSLQRGSEFGPRALGARSILADPRKRSVWTFINKWVKYREEFRPFAPMVIHEALNDYFEATPPLPYMLEVVKVRQDFRLKLAAVTHVDGSARVQTVSCSDNPEIYALLQEFRKLSGFPILLNTSFNVRGQPIVEHPVHALEMLLSTQLSGVIFGDLLVEILPNGKELGLDSRFQMSPGTSLHFDCGQYGMQGMLKVQSQGKKIHISQIESQVLKALVQGDCLRQALHIATTSEQYDGLVDTINRYRRLRILNLLRSGTEI